MKTSICWANKSITGIPRIGLKVAGSAAAIISGSNAVARSGSVLAAPDAQAVEETFQAKLATLAANAADVAETQDPPSASRGINGRDVGKPRTRSRS
jgi:hypothetical protein